MAVLPHDDVSSGERLPIHLMLLFGGISGLVGQTLTYPLDVVRRRMQVQGVVQQASCDRFQGNLLSPPRQLNQSTLGCMVGMMREQGLRSLFHGLHINYMKVVPSTALGFTIYDFLKSKLMLANHM